jgi:hypothetical protein
VKDALEERRKGFENEFFAKENERLLELMRAARERKEQRRKLARVCGVDDEALLDRLLAQGVNGESLTALALVPLIATAWADKEMAPLERRVVLEAAHELGIEPHSPPYELLSNWLESRPPDRLREAWNDYVGVLCDVLDPADRETFKRSVMDWATGVAEAAGGVLRIGPKVSSDERAMLAQLEQAFE